MKTRFSTLLTALLMIMGGTVQAQLLVGPTAKIGITYGKNFIYEDTSQYYLENSPSLYFAGGLDVLYQFNERIRLQTGVQYSQLNYSLADPSSSAEGLSFGRIERASTSLSVPIALHYRVPIREGGKVYLNFIAGHSLEFTSEDSVVTKTPSGLVAAGEGWTRHEFQDFKTINFDTADFRFGPSVLLGVGADIEMGNGSVLNASLLWGLGTATRFRGNIGEWEALDADFDPADQEFPAEFPEHYYDFAFRGSTLSLKLSYWFNLGNPFKAKDKDKEQDKEEL